MDEVGLNSRILWSRYKAWIFALLIAAALQVPFYSLLYGSGPHSSTGGAVMMFFWPSLSIVSLVSRDGLPFAAVLVCQNLILCIPIFWLLTAKNRSVRSTLARVCCYAVLLALITVVLTRYEDARWRREDAIKSAASNAVVSSLITINKSLALYQAKYGEYPERLEQLNYPNDGPVDSSHAEILKLPMPMNEFFSFSYRVEKSAGRNAHYQIYADPKQGKWSDLSHYFTDENALIRFDTTHDASRTGPVVNEQLHPSVTAN